MRILDASRKGWRDLLARRLALSVALAAVIGLVPGCDRTPAETFDARHGGKTHTTHGVIIDGSAEDTTIDGEQWVTYTTVEQVERHHTWRVRHYGNGEFGNPVPVRTEDVH